MRKIIHTTVNPSFTRQKWGLRGSNLYRHVVVMSTRRKSTGGHKSSFIRAKSHPLSPDAAPNRTVIQTDRRQTVQWYKQTEERKQSGKAESTVFIETYASLQIETWCSNIITKTCLYNFDPRKPHFYIVKLGFTGVNIIFSYFCSKT